jgi:serine/threonine protein kinase
MSPEQFSSQPVDGRSDLFSLGIILYELATGKRPFGGEHLAATFSSVTLETPMEPGKINPDIPDRLSHIIMKCLNKNPEERFDRGKSLAGALRNMLQEFAPATAVPLPPTAKKKPWYVFFVPIGIALFLAGILIYSFVIPGEKKTVAPKTEPVQKLEEKVEKKVFPLLKVESMPKGAQVIVNGLPKGNTPITLELSAGMHRIKLTLSSYQDWETQIELKEEGETPLHVQLKPMIKKGTKDARPIW